MPSRYAFTLIELLIVVAIIAILAAIAVPNFLEAQTRSKVSRVRADHRTIGIGMETYRVDWNSYPPPWAYSYRVHPTGPVQQGLGPYSFSACDNYLLTTPLAYLTSVPLDVFRIQAGAQDTFYPLYATKRGTANASYEPPFDSYMTWSYGPDLREETGGYRPEEFIIQFESTGPSRSQVLNLYRGMRYDPTNGTVSIGDLYYFGPNARANFN